MALDMTKPAVYRKDGLTIEAVSDTTDKKVAWVTIKGCKERLKFWVSGLAQMPVAVGEVAAAEITIKEGKNASGQPCMEAWLTEWNGKRPETKKPAGGAGGGRAFTPKTVAEIHSASICGLVKSAMDQSQGDCQKASKLAECAIDAYVKGLTRVIAEVKG